MLNNYYIILVLIGQIDGQEITASAVLAQRVRPPPRRPSPPRRMPPPPPMWRRSPPRMRRRYILVAHSSCLPTTRAFFPAFLKKCLCPHRSRSPRRRSPARRRSRSRSPGRRRHRSRSSSNSSRQTSFLPPDLLDSLSEQQQFLFSQASWTHQKLNHLHCSQQNTCLHVFLCKCEFFFFFFHILCKVDPKKLVLCLCCVWSPLRSTNVSFFFFLNVTSFYHILNFQTF